jgi:rhamnosyltransferase
MTSNPSVAVLLTAFNGIKWIREQIESIFNQKDVDIKIYISVDLSNDGTYEWCKELALKNSNVNILPYGNHFGGAAKNFYRLIKEVDFSKYDYISLADQDDIWLPQKISRAIKIINVKKLDGYSSNVIAFWQDGRKQFIKKSYPQNKFDYYFESAGPGCTFLLKQQSLKKFKDFLIKNWTLVNDVKLHDWMIYAFFRELSMVWYIDDISSLYYRQHTNNQIGANFNWRSYFSRFKKIKNKWARNEVQKIINLLKPYSKNRISLDYFFLIINFNKLRRRYRDRLFLLFINLIRLF